MPSEADLEITEIELEDDAQALEGYLVKVRIEDESHEWMVLGTDLAQAAARAVELVADQQPGGQVIELCYCADLL